MVSDVAFAKSNPLFRQDFQRALSVRLSTVCLRASVFSRIESFSVKVSS